MILLKIVKNDFLKKKLITSFLFIFILLSALLSATGVNMIVTLFNSMDYLFTQSKIPDFVQLHADPINKEAITQWALNNPLVKHMQIVEMNTIDRSDLYLNNSVSEKNSVMDIDFVTQNKTFDLLLNSKNQVVKPPKGKIALSIYYQKTKNLKIGDKVKIAQKNFNMTFTIVDFIRDPLMNPAIVHSKRFLINQEDFNVLKNNIGSLEYLIEFQLFDPNKLNVFRNSYESSNLPKTGISLDFQMFKTLNMVTDGLIIGMLLIISMLLITIATLCIKLTILATLEEDYKEIGVMKGIGIQKKDIRNLYLIKYVLMAGLGCIFGYLICLPLIQVFSANITAYLGIAPKNLLYYLSPIAAACVIFLFIIFSSLLILRKINKITTMNALRTGVLGEQGIIKNYFLHKNNRMPINFFLGLQDVLQRFKQFRLLFFIFLICSCISIIPVNFLNTAQSPNFISYMGIPKSDIRIDSSLTDSDLTKLNNAVNYLKNDKDVLSYMSVISSQFKVINLEGKTENLRVDTGNFSLFPLAYLQGIAPKHTNEIALSYLNSQALKKNVGDHLLLIANHTKKDMVVSGIYQDITNGGRTAKSIAPFNPETIIGYMINLNLKQHVSIQKKLDEYTKTFHPSRVNSIKSYLAQTLGTLINQMMIFTLMAIFIALFITMLITYLSLKMLFAKDRSKIAIMKSLGFSTADIKIQYITKLMIILVTAIFFGTIISIIGGQYLVNILGSFMGATQIKLVIIPVQTCVILPFSFLIAVTLVTWLNSSLSIHQTNIAKLIQE